MPGMLALDAFVRALPKAELHLHLEGSLSAATLAALAKKHGLALPADETSLYDFTDLEGFFDTYELCSQAMRDADDFHRVTYEALARCAENGARYVEFFYNPQPHIMLGAGYAAMTDGIVAAMADAERDHGVVSGIIPSYDRRLGPGPGAEFLEMLAADRRDEVIGIGIDYLEHPYTPAAFDALFEGVRRLGLRTTAHVGFRGPAAHVREAVDVLRCERIDHGYHIADDPAVIEHCRERGIGFTCCPTSALRGSIWRNPVAPDHPIRAMIEAGLLVTLNTDDPTLMRTDLNTEYLIVARQMGVGRERLGELALNGLRISWLSDERKTRLLAEWRKEIDQLLSPTGLASEPVGQDLFSSPQANGWNLR